MSSTCDLHIPECLMREYKLLEQRANNKSCKTNAYDVSAFEKFKSIIDELNFAFTSIASSYNITFPDMYSYYIYRTLMYFIQDFRIGTSTERYNERIEELKSYMRSGTLGNYTASEIKAHYIRWNCTKPEILELTTQMDAEFLAAEDVYNFKYSRSISEQYGPVCHKVSYEPNLFPVVNI